MLFNNTNIVCCEQMIAGNSASIGHNSTTGNNSSSLMTAASSSMQSTQNQSPTLNHRSHHTHHHHHHNHHQLQNHNIAISQQSTKDQNDVKHHLAQPQQQTKGLKRRNESAAAVEGIAPAPVVLGSNSAINISQHEQDQEMTNGSISAVSLTNSNPVVPNNCGRMINKSNGTSMYSSSHLHVESLDSNNGRSNNNNNDQDDPTCDGEEYDYSSILAKILHEKKLVSVLQSFN